MHVQLILLIHHHHHPCGSLIVHLLLLFLIRVLLFVFLLAITSPIGQLPLLLLHGQGPYLRNLCKLGLIKLMLLIVIIFIVVLVVLVVDEHLLVLGHEVAAAALGRGHADEVYHLRVVE